MHELLGVIEVIKSPCQCRGFECVSFEAEGESYGQHDSYTV